jgi:TRAP-type C4-dicarboxylate transport system permease small subunit
VPAIIRAYDRLVTALAAGSGVVLGSIFLVIIYDVTLRELGFRPPTWTIGLSEYALLYSTVLAAPWLLRERGHVVVTVLLGALPTGPKRAIGRVICLIGAAVCLIIAWYGLQVTMTVTGLEIRGFEMPRWVVFAVLPPGFLLLAIEFARFGISGQKFYTDPIDEREGL